MIALRGVGRCKWERLLRSDIAAGRGLSPGCLAPPAPSGQARVAGAAVGVGIGIAGARVRADGVSRRSWPDVAITIACTAVFLRTTRACKGDQA